MTIKEALVIKAKSLSLTDGEIDLAIIDAKLIGTSDYDLDVNGKDVDLTYAGLLLTTIQVAEKKEDDVSIKYGFDPKAAYSAIMRKWGLVDPFLVVVVKPTVKQINFH